MIDLTREVQSVVVAADAKQGLATVFVRGSTAAISTMEFEPGGVADLRAMLDRLIPASGDYEHNRLNRDSNSHAHQRATLIGPSEQVPVIDGGLALGVWQQLVLIDFDDRPRDRTVIVQVQLVSGGGDRLLWVGVALVAVAVVIAALAIAGVFTGDDTAPEAEDFGLTSTDTTPAPAAPRAPAVKRIRVGGTPDTISAGGGYVWVVDSLGGTLKRINPRSHRPVAVEAAGFPTDVSAGEGGAWLALPDRGAVQRVTREGPSEPVRVGGLPFQIAVGYGAAWAMSQSSVERVDAGGGNLDGPPMRLGGHGSAIAAGEGWIWIVRGDREVVRIAPPGGAPEDATGVPGAFNVTVGEGAAWVLGTGGGLTRIDPGTGAAAGKPVPTGRPLDLAAGLGYVWVTNAGGTVLRLDPKTGTEVGVPIEVGAAPESIVVGEGAVWVACAGAASVYRIAP